MRAALGSGKYLRAKLPVSKKAGRTLSAETGHKGLPPKTKQGSADWKEGVSWVR